MLRSADEFKKWVHEEEQDKKIKVKKQKQKKEKVVLDESRLTEKLHYAVSKALHSAFKKSNESHNQSSISSDSSLSTDSDLDSRWAHCMNYVWYL